MSLCHDLSRFQVLSWSELTFLPRLLVQCVCHQTLLQSIPQSTTTATRERYLQLEVDTEMKSQSWEAAPTPPHSSSVGLAQTVLGSGPQLRPQQKQCRLECVTACSAAPVPAARLVPLKTRAGPEIINRLFIALREELKGRGNMQSWEGPLQGKCWKGLRWRTSYQMLRFSHSVALELNVLFGLILSRNLILRETKLFGDCRNTSQIFKGKIWVA